MAVAGSSKAKAEFINITLIRTLNCTLLTPHYILVRDMG